MFLLVTMDFFSYLMDFFQEFLKKRGKWGQRKAVCPFLASTDIIFFNLIIQSFIIHFQDS